MQYAITLPDSEGDFIVGEEDWYTVSTSFEGLDDLKTPTEQPEPEATAEPETPDSTTTDKASPDTGAEGIAVVFGAAIAAGATVILSRKKR